VCLWGCMSDGNCGGDGGGARYVGGLAAVDPAVPSCGFRHHEYRPFFFVSISAWRGVRRAPSLYQAIAGAG